MLPNYKKKTCYFKSSGNRHYELPEITKGSAEIALTLGGFYLLSEIFLFFALIRLLLTFNFNVRIRFFHPPPKLHLLLFLFNFHFPEFFSVIYLHLKIAKQREITQALGTNQAEMSLDFILIAF